MSFNLVKFTEYRCVKRPPPHAADLLGGIDGGLGRPFSSDVVRNHAGVQGDLAHFET